MYLKQIKNLLYNQQTIKNNNKTEISKDDRKRGEENFINPRAVLPSRILFISIHIYSFIRSEGNKVVGTFFSGLGFV